MLAFEFVFAVAILFALNAFALLNYRHASPRAMATEAVSALQPYKYLWIEEHAVNGEVSLDSLAYARGGTDTTTSVSPGSAVLGLREFEQVRAVRPRGEEDLERSRALRSRDDATREIRAGLSDSVPTSAVRAAYLPEPRLFELWPAIASVDPASVTWLCGAQAAPAGWIAAAPREPQLPMLYLPTTCRKESSP